MRFFLKIISEQSPSRAKRKKNNYKNINFDFAVLCRAKDPTLWWEHGCARQLQIFFIERLHVVGSVGLGIAFFQVPFAMHIYLLKKKSLISRYCLFYQKPNTAIWSDRINAPVLHN